MASFTIIWQQPLQSILVLRNRRIFRVLHLPPPISAIAFPHLFISGHTWSHSRLGKIAWFGAPQVCNHAGWWCGRSGASTRCSLIGPWATAKIVVSIMGRVWLISNHHSLTQGPYYYWQNVSWGSACGGGTAMNGPAKHAHDTAG